MVQKPNTDLKKPSLGNNPSQELSNELKLHPVVELITDAFDYEYVRIMLKSKMNDSKEGERINTWIYDLYLKIDFFTFFTDQSLQKVVEEVFLDEYVRQFVLNVAERVTLGFDFLTGESVEAFRDNVVKSLIRTRPNPESNNSLLSPEIISSIYIEGEVLKVLLADNFWMIVLYVLLCNFHHTNVYPDFCALVANRKIAVKDKA